MKFKMGVCVLAALLVCTMAAMAADAAGQWSAKTQGRDGQEMQVTFSLKVDGQKLTGTVSSQMGGATEITDGKVDGDTITFKVKRTRGERTMISVYKGKVAGDEIKFTQSTEGSERPPREFTAKRAK